MLIGEPRRLIAIVEGKGEIAAVPALLRRVLGEMHYRYDIQIGCAIPTGSKSRLIKQLAHFLSRAKNQRCDAVLVLVDADRECPVERAASLVETASMRNIGIPVAVVCANSAYETWFISSLSADTGQGVRDRTWIVLFRNVSGLCRIHQECQGLSV